MVHDDVIKRKHFPRNWPFVRGIHRSPVYSPHKGQWRGALIFSLIYDWVNNRAAGDLRRFRAHYDVVVKSHSQFNSNGNKCLSLWRLPGQIIRSPFHWMVHDDVIKRKHFPRNWPFVRGIHRSPVYSPHKGQWRGALIFSLIYVWINDWVNNRASGELRRFRAHYDVVVMSHSQFNSNGNKCLSLWRLPGQIIFFHMPVTAND